MNVIQGNVGKKELKTNENGPLLVLAIAEEKYAPPTVDPQTGKNVWADPETVWHNDVIITGENAHIFDQTFSKGDPVILVGNLGDVRTSTTKDGRVFENQSFFVSNFGPDATKSQVIVKRHNREQKSNKASTQNQDQDQEWASEEVTPNYTKLIDSPKETAAAEPPPADELDALQARADKFQAEQNTITTSNELQRRTKALIESGRVDEMLMQRLGHAFGSSHDAASLHENVARELATYPEYIKEYLGSVPGQLAGHGKAKKWSEVAPASAPKSEPCFTDTMNQVSAIREQVKSQTL